jgi:NADPH:quinone reductase-like Zn-dependent oxidoreductase
VRAYHLSPGAGIAGLTLRDQPVPDPGPTEALVRVHATGLNYRELLVARDTYPLPLKPDLIPVSDGAGQVVAVGTAVTRVAPGDRIVASIFPRWLDGPFDTDVSAQLGGSLDGMLTEYAALDQDALVPIPEHFSYEQAATLPCAAVTAWHALTGGRGVQPGETVLTLGSGGVSLFTLQFARLFGARVIATTSSDAKAAQLSALGAEHVLNYRTAPDWPERVRDLTQAPAGGRQPSTPHRHDPRDHRPRPPARDRPGLRLRPRAGRLPLLPGCAAARQGTDRSPINSSAGQPCHEAQL